MRPTYAIRLTLLFTALALFQSCARVEVSKEPNKRFPLPADQLQSKIVSIVEKPPLEFQVLRAGKGKIYAQKEYLGDPYGVAFLKKRKDERATLSIRLTPHSGQPNSTDLFVKVTLEEREVSAMNWSVKQDPDKRQEIVSTLLERLDLELLHPVSAP